MDHTLFYVINLCNLVLLAFLRHIISLVDWFQFIEIVGFFLWCYKLVHSFYNSWYRGRIPLNFVLISDSFRYVYCISNIFDSFVFVRICRIFFQYSSLVHISLLSTLILWELFMHLDTKWVNDQQYVHSTFEYLWL